MTSTFIKYIIPCNSFSDETGCMNCTHFVCAEVKHKYLAEAVFFCASEVFRKWLNGGLGLASYKRCSDDASRFKPQAGAAFGSRTDSFNGFLVIGTGSPVSVQMN